MVSLDLNKRYTGIRAIIPPRMISYVRRKSLSEVNVDGPYASDKHSILASTVEIDEDGGMAAHLYYDDPSTAPCRRRGTSIEHNIVAASEWCKTLGRRASLIARTDNQHNSADQDSKQPATRSERSRSLPFSVHQREVYSGLYSRKACVMTTFGTGTIQDHLSKENIYVIQVVALGTAYLQPSQILREIKAVVGERVRTRWGYALIEHYYVDGDMYGLAFDWRWDNEHVWKMKASRNKFERIPTTAIGQTVQLMQHTKKHLFNGVTSIRESSYANKMYRMAKAKRKKMECESISAGKDPSAPNFNLDLEDCVAVTAFGLATVRKVRDSNKIFILEYSQNVTGYFQADTVELQRRQFLQTWNNVRKQSASSQLDGKHFIGLTSMKLLNVNADDADTPTAVNTGMLKLENDITNGQRRLSSFISKTKQSMVSASVSARASATGHMTNIAQNMSAVVAASSKSTTGHQRFHLGERVLASYFGSGRIQKYRPSDCIYTILLRRSQKIGFFHESSLRPFPYDKVTHLTINGAAVHSKSSDSNLAATFTHK
ncbi:hypothetical protein ABG067_001430 [Albugo candida]|uniref:Uncharacterized protein n=2 Tax=Albugo candida TaxID=65357 RepID=A0A024GUQ2_9STRA|nr:unnamed protein product [Albugo candida]|eukprot:CCI50512.1 unnamed protein product [Albugo candida]